MRHRPFTGMVIILMLLTGCGVTTPPAPTPLPALTKNIEDILANTAPPNGIVLGRLKTADISLGIDNVGDIYEAEQLWTGTNIVGGSKLLMYETTQAAQVQFTQLEGALTITAHIPELGENAVITDSTLSINIFFIRCRVIGNVWATSLDTKTLVDYSRDLDTAIRQSFCP